MFFSSPSTDLIIIIWLLGFSLFVSLLVFIFSRKTLLSLFIFSVLANLIFYLDRRSELPTIYNVEWATPIAVKYWPILNLAFFIFLISKKSLAKKLKK